MPCIETYQKVDLRTITLGVPPQEVSLWACCCFDMRTCPYLTIRCWPRTAWRSRWTRWCTTGSATPPWAWPTWRMPITAPGRWEALSELTEPCQCCGIIWWITDGRQRIYYSDETIQRVLVINISLHFSPRRLLSQTTLRNILGTKNLHEILSDREGISGAMQVSVIGQAAAASRFINI